MRIFSLLGGQHVIQATPEELKTIKQCIDFTLAGLDESASPPDVERAQKMQTEIARVLR